MLPEPRRSGAAEAPASRTDLPAPGSSLRPLTSIRFLAAIAVVFAHVLGGFASAHLGAHWASAGPGPGATVRNRLVQITSLGQLGPNLFFVLSGVVLYWAYEATHRLQQSGGRASFFMARVARLTPLYVCGLALGILSLKLGLTCPDRGLVCTRGKSLFSVGMSGVVQQGWLPWSSDATNGPSWTLSAEFLFYLSFPLVLIPLRRLRPQATALLLAGSLLLCEWRLVAGWVLPPPPATYTGNAASQLWYLAQRAPVMHLPEFVAGLALGRLLTLGCLPRVSARVALGVTAAVPVVLVFFALWGKGLIHQSAVALGTAGGFDALFCVLIAVLATAEVPSLSGPRLFLLGEASYGLYIIHWPVWFLFQKAAPFGLNHLGPYLIWAGVYVVTVVVLSVLGFRFIEQPCRRAITAWWRSRPQPSM